MHGKLGKGIIVVLFANVVNLIVGIIGSFILPKYLSVETYAAIKDYQLWYSYIGILHLGYNDAMYLKYGGQTINQLDRNECMKGISNIRIYTFIISSIGVIISFIIKYPILTCVFIIAPPTIMMSYYQFLYQACGEFKKYGKLLNAISIGIFFINVFLIFIIKTDNYIYYLILYIVLSYTVCGIIEISFSKTLCTPVKFNYFSPRQLFCSMRKGILLTLGNFSSTLMTSMDRWFVKILMNTVMFAQYSFAVSMENFLNILISPITVTLYNYFCNHKNAEDIRRIRSIVVVFGSIIIAAAFPIKFIVNIYLTKYIEATSVITLLFASQFFYVIVKGIYVNLYKSRGEVNLYFKELVFVIVFGFIANLVSYHLLGTKESFAIATLLSSVVWFVKCIIKDRDFSIREFIFIMLCLSVFLAVGYACDPLLGLIIYVIFAISMAFILFKGLMLFLVKYAFQLLKRKSKIQS